MSPEDPDADVRLYVALGHNRGDFRCHASEHRALVDQHLMWCLDQRERGWLLSGGAGTVPADNLTIFATTSRAELARVLDLDPLVAAGVRHYAISGCHATEPARLLTDPRR
ncbi:MAG: hypothetical protein LC635_05185 [Pseudonocardiaceae bacterium]|nr:hypothetical protein [Pseudonocardiaceae bacterium]